MLSKKELIYLIKLIRKELKTKKTDWVLVENLSKACNLYDTAYYEMLNRKNKKGLLNDYLLYITYQNKKV